MSQDSVVRIVTCYRMDRPGLESRRGKVYISSSETVQNGPGAHLASYSVGTGIISRGQDDREVKCIVHPLTVRKVKMRGAIPLFYLYDFLEWQGENFLRT